MLGEPGLSRKESLASSHLGWSLGRRRISPPGQGSVLGIVGLFGQRTSSPEQLDSPSGFTGQLSSLQRMAGHPEAIEGGPGPW
jgi:hypothetical protein